MYQVVIRTKWSTRQWFFDFLHFVDSSYNKYINSFFYSIFPIHHKTRCHPRSTILEYLEVLNHLIFKDPLLGLQVFQAMTILSHLCIVKEYVRKLMWSTEHSQLSGNVRLTQRIEMHRMCERDRERWQQKLDWK